MIHLNLKPLEKECLIEISLQINIWCDTNLTYQIIMSDSASNFSLSSTKVKIYIKYLKIVLRQIQESSF
jgi:hypothetical protein